MHCYTTVRSSIGSFKKRHELLLVTKGKRMINKKLC